MLGAASADLGAGSACHDGLSGRVPRRYSRGMTSGGNDKWIEFHRRLAGPGDATDARESWRTLAEEVRQLCRGFLRGRAEEIEEATQESLLAIARAMRRGGPRAEQAMFAWVRTVARHECIRVTNPRSKVRSEERRVGKECRL